MKNNKELNIGNILSSLDGKNFSDLWENAFKQKVEVIEDDGKKTTITVPTINIDLNSIKAKK